MTKSQPTTNPLAEIPAITVTEPERVYVAIELSYPGSWGKGPSLEEAKRQAVRASANPRKLMVLRLPIGAREAAVDTFGRLTWMDSKPMPRDKAPLPELVELPRGRKLPDGWNVIDCREVRS
jgi:hypothetical protein